jgi:hypothetical protein
MLVSCAGQRARLKVACGEECLEYVGRVPRASEMRQWPAGQKFGAACILARPGSLDPANPISPQVQYLKIIDGEWCLVRMRLQDSEPLEIRRLGKDIQVMIEALDDR